MKEKVNRRTFLKHSAVLGAGITVLKSGILRAGNSPNEKLNIAAVGVGVRGPAIMRGKSLRPVIEMLPVQMITLALAAMAGLEAGAFALASKVTLTE